MPFALHHIGVAIVGIPFLLVLHLISYLATICYDEQKCRLDNMGLHYKVGSDSRRIRKHQIHTWNIGDHARIAGIRILTIKAALCAACAPSYDQLNLRVTDEARQCQLLREHVRV